MKPPNKTLAGFITSKIIGKINGKKESFMGSIEFQSNVPALLRIASNEDQFGEHRSLVVSQITLTVTP
jgi:hypothetical protein